MFYVIAVWQIDRRAGLHRRHVGHKLPVLVRHDRRRQLVRHLARERRDPDHRLRYRHPTRGAHLRNHFRAVQRATGEQAEQGGEPFRN